MEIKIDVVQRKAVWASVIASLIVLYFLDPILSFLGSLFLAVARFAFQSYLDQLYSEIATGDPNIAFYAAAFILCSPFVFVLYMVGRAIFRLFRADSLQPPEEQSIEALEKSINRMRLFVKANIAVLAMLGLLMTVDFYVRIKSSSTFRQHATIVRPYVSESEYYIFLSRYASMNSEGDYDNLLRDLKVRADANGIDLPPNKLYPF